MSNECQSPKSKTLLTFQLWISFDIRALTFEIVVGVLDARTNLFGKRRQILQL